MNTAEAVVAAALSEVGYTEHPPGSNCNKFALEAGLTNCTYWCAAGTSAILIRERVKVPPGVLTLSTRANLAAWQKAGRWIQPADIQAGDIVFDHLTGRNGPWPTPDHTAIATGRPSRAGRLPSVEFNTSADSRGSQDNGGGVYRKNRLMLVVIGAGRPYYETTPAPPDDDQEDEDMDYIGIPVDGNGKRHKADGTPVGAQVFVSPAMWFALYPGEPEALVKRGYKERELDPFEALAIIGNRVEHKRS